MLSAAGLDAHEPPPQALKVIFKKYYKLKPADLEAETGILDFSRSQLPAEVDILDRISGKVAESAFRSFLPQRQVDEPLAIDEIQVFQHKSLPGLYILPSVLPAPVQKHLVSRLLHEELSDARHKTNVHLHHEIEYPATPTCGNESPAHPNARSFFSYDPASGVVLQPRDPSTHKPLSIAKFLQKSLRWVTLGGQYDWTLKRYPEEKPPPFPEDIGDLLRNVFPRMEPEAAIVNVYTPGDTLSLHRDVSESCDRGLISVSLGCDCIFIVGHGQTPADHVIVRLRSGDGVFMSGEARFAWHGVPKILTDTCPSSLQDWPAESGRFEQWRGWMKNKRINLNVRQMFE